MALIDQYRNTNEYRLPVVIVGYEAPEETEVFIPLPEVIQDFIVTVPFFEPTIKQEVVETVAPIVSVQITKVTASGEAYLEFNTLMKTDIEIGNDDLDVYLISGEVNVDVNLTWSIQSYEEDVLVLKLDFNKSQDISSSFGYDMLVVHFKVVKNKFISEEYLADLSEEFHTV